MKSCSLVVIAILLCAVVVVAQPASTGRPGDAKAVQASFGKLPLYFVENRGVYPDEVRYYIQGADKTLFFADGGVTIALKGKKQGWAVKLDFVGANPVARPDGRDRQDVVFSYLVGREKDWKAGLPTFSSVIYRDLWPGIDLVYRGTVDKLKYEFVVGPGADASRIRVRYRGASSVEVTSVGALRVETPGGSFEDAPPAAWQERDGKRVAVEMAYRLGPPDAVGDVAFGFTVGAYDRTRPLILDPAVLVYTGFICGSVSEAGNESITGIAVDTFGCAYVVGNTDDHRSFPVKVGPTLAGRGGVDVFVAKMNASGTGLVYCGFICGTSYEGAGGIAVDATGCAYVTGETRSGEKTFPVKVGPDLTHNGESDVFVTKVNAKGTGLEYCGYVGGRWRELAGGIAVDAAGNAYITGSVYSGSRTFPVAIGPDLTRNGGEDAFVAKLNAAGTRLMYCGYIGGVRDDAGTAIAVDAAGVAYVVGTALSDEKSFPVSSGPDLTHNGGFDAFVARVNAKGTALDYCGYVGGTLVDAGRGVAVDRFGCAYVTGYTESDQRSFPVNGGTDSTQNGEEDAFVAKVNAKGTGLVYCGYIGGTRGDRGEGIAVDPFGCVFVAGCTSTLWGPSGFPVKTGPSLKSGDYGDGFVAKLSASGSDLVYCGFVSPRHEHSGALALAVDRSGNAYVAGYTAYRADAFMAKVSLVLLEGGGAPQPGGSVALVLTASPDVGLTYQVGTSLGAGPIAIDKRSLNLSPDGLLFASVSNALPTVFSGYRGAIDAWGKATALIRIPRISAVIGVQAHSAFVTLDPAAPSGIKSISNTYSFTIVK